MQRQPRPRPPGHHRRRPPRAVILRRRITVLSGLAVVIALICYSIAASIGGPTVKTPSSRTPGRSSLTTATTPAASSFAAVGVRDVSYVDPTRQTYSYTTGKLTNGRHVTIELRYPATVHANPLGATVADAPVAKHKAYPFVLFAPGYRLAPRDYDALLNGWVDAGYVVGTVEFPDTTAPAPDAAYAAGTPYGSPEGDLFHEPGDVAFALSSLKSASATKGSWLSDLIDWRSVVLAGHSDGASAVAAVVYDAPYAVAGLGVAGVVVLAGAEFAIAGQSYGQPSEKAIPLLVVQSSADECNLPDSAVQLYNAIGAPKYFDEILGASHLGMVNGTDAAASAVVLKLTEAFFASVAGHGQVTATTLSADGTVANLSSFTSVATAAPITSQTTTPVCPADTTP